MGTMNNHWSQQLPDRDVNTTAQQKNTTVMANAARRRRICGLRRKLCRSLSLSRQWLTVLSLLRIWAVSSQPDGTPPLQDSNLTRTPIAQPPPTAVPTITPMPTTTQPPSNQPTVSFKPTLLPSHPPSLAPTLSSQPSSGPSHEPSFKPTTSPAPSNPPSISFMPTRSSAPTTAPTPKPTLTRIPTDPPTVAPSNLPSSFPSTPAPSVSPTPPLDPAVTEPFLSMTLSNIPSNATFKNETFGWRRLTSEHVRTYWRSFGDDSPIYIGRALTLWSSETWDSTATVMNGNVTYGTVTIRYSQEVTFLRRNNTSDPYPGFKTSDIFTLPFQQNPRPYTLALGTLFNNSITTEPSAFIFLLDSGLYNPTVRSHKDNTVIAATVSTVSVVLICVTGYIIYLTNYKHREGESQAGDGINEDVPPIVEAVIGVNPNENILISESYDEEYVDVCSPNKKPSDQAGGNGDGGGGGGDGNTPALPARDENYLGSDDGEPPVRDLMAAPEDGAFPTLSNANISPAEVGMMGESPYADTPMFSYRSSAHGSLDSDPNMSPLGTSPQRRTPQGSGSDEDLDVQDADESEEPTAPFMGFQMEIEDLE